MKLRLITLALAIVMAAAMPIARSLQTLGSNAAVWAEVANYPGALIAIWTFLNMRVAQNIAIFLGVTVLVNWAFYFWIIKGLLFLKHGLSKKRTPASRSHIRA